MGCSCIGRDVWPGKNTEMLSGHAEMGKESQVQMELCLARDVKKKKGLYMYIDQKRQTKESVPL